MIWTARSPSSSATNRTVTRAFTFGFPSMRVSGVITKVCVSGLEPSTVRLTVILSSEMTVIVPEKKWSWGCWIDGRLLCALWARGELHANRRHTSPHDRNRTPTAYCNRMKPSYTGD